jgi:DNA polymerase
MGSAAGEGEIVQPSLFGVAGLPSPPPPSTATAAAADERGAGLDAALERLAAACDSCRRCPLAAGRQRVVVSRGNPRAPLLVIGEGPGAQEDASGLPFVGRAGQLLDQMLASVGIDSNRDAYIANVVKCRPPENRKPTPAEMEACRPWLLEQVALVRPAVVVLAGATAVEGVLGIRGGITRLRGQWHRWDGLWCLPIFHPSYLLRNPSRERGTPKWHTWQDLQEVRRRLEELSGEPPTADGPHSSAAP